MIILFLILLSAVLSVHLINIIPFGLEKRQKKIIFVAAPVIGSIGLAFTYISSLWQSVLVMVLFAGSAGYVIVSRTSESIEAGTARMLDTIDVSKADVLSDKSISVDQEPPLMDTSFSNAVSLKQEEMRMAEDISFLEVRKNQELELNDLDVIPVLNFVGPKDEENHHHSINTLHL